MIMVVPTDPDCNCNYLMVMSSIPDGGTYRSSWWYLLVIMVVPTDPDGNVFHSWW